MNSGGDEAFKVAQERLNTFNLPEIHKSWMWWPVHTPAASENT
jgi:hypothetical protein